MTSWPENTAYITALLWKKFTGHRCFSSNAGLWRVIDVKPFEKKQSGCRWLRTLWCSGDVTVMKRIYTATCVAIFALTMFLLSDPTRVFLVSINSISDGLGWAFLGRCLNLIPLYYSYPTWKMVEGTKLEWETLLDTIPGRKLIKIIDPKAAFTKMFCLRLGHQRLIITHLFL